MGGGGCGRKGQMKKRDEETGNRKGRLRFVRLILKKRRQISKFTKEI